MGILSPYRCPWRKQMQHVIAETTWRGKRKITFVKDIISYLHGFNFFYSKMISINTKMYVHNKHIYMKNNT